MGPADEKICGHPEGLQAPWHAILPQAKSSVLYLCDPDVKRCDAALWAAHL